MRYLQQNGVITWTVLACALMALAVLRWPPGQWLSTDFHSLLPAQHSKPWQRAATQQAASGFEQQLLLLANGEHAEKFLDYAEQTLAQAGYVDEGFEDHQTQLWQQLIAHSDDFRLGLATQNDLQQLHSDPELYLKQFRQLIFSPIGSRWAGNLAQDPLGLQAKFWDQQLNTAIPDSDVTLRTVQLPAEQLSFNALDGLYALYQELKLEAAKRDIPFQALGSPLYSAYGIESARAEISTIGLASLLLLLILLIAVFRSAQSLLLSLLAIVSAMAAGFVVTLAVFGQINLLALVFAATLIGIVADYSFHFLAHRLQPAWQAEHDLKPLLRTMLFSAGSSCAAFFVLVFIPFPGLQQIGLLMAAGLAFGFTTVCLLYPRCYRPHQQRSKFARALSQPRWPTLPLGWQAIVVVVVTVPGLMLLSGEDDIRHFYATPQDLDADRHSAAQYLSQSDSSAFILLQQADQESLLQLEETLRLQQPGLRGISNIVPSMKQQGATIALRRELMKNPALAVHFAALGMDERYQNNYASQLQAATNTLTLNELSGLELPLGLGGFLGCSTQGCASWMPVDASSQASLKAVVAELPGASLIDPVAQINHSLQQYRSWTLSLLAVAAVIITLVLTLLLGWREALAIAWLPAAAGMLSLAFVGYVTAQLSIVNILALYIILGMGLDYAIFLNLSGKHKQPAVALAIILSAATSLLAFGMLSLSSTPVIASFGLSIGSGLFFAWLLATLHPARK